MRPAGHSKGKLMAEKNAFYMALLQSLVPSETLVQDSLLSGETHGVSSAFGLLAGCIKGTAQPTTGLIFQQFVLSQEAPNVLLQSQ